MDTEEVIKAYKEIIKSQQEIMESLSGIIRAQAQTISNLTGVQTQPLTYTTSSQTLTPNPDPKVIV